MAYGNNKIFNIKIVDRKPASVLIHSNVLDYETLEGTRGPHRTADTRVLPLPVNGVYGQLAAAPYFTPMFRQLYL